MKHQNWSIDRWGRTGLAALVLTGLLTGLFAGAWPAGAAEVKRGGTLTLARPDEPLTFDPWIPSDNGSIWAIVQVCEPLVAVDATGEGLAPGLAESWKVSVDGLNYTFNLRDAKFSDGKPVTAADAVFSLKKVANPDAVYGFAFSPVQSITAVGDKQIEMKLDSPYTALLSALTLFSASVVSQAAYEADPEQFGTKPVCSGPFQVAEYERGSRVVLVPNPHHWARGIDGKPLPYLDRVEMLYVPESNSRVLGLRNGDYDVISTVPFNQAKSVANVGGVSLEVAPMYRLDYVYLNHEAKPFDDKRIRLAANHAANREAIMNVVYFGYGQVPNGYMPKMNFHSEKVPLISFDVAKAKSLVAEAGYDGAAIKLMVDTGNAPFRQIATILQQGWREAGLNAEIVEFDVGTSYGMVEKGDYQAYVSYITSDINDDDELAVFQGDGTGSTEAFFSRYNNPEVTALLMQARAESDPGKRGELYAKVQETAYWDGYSVPLNYVPAINAYQNHVQNWRNLTTGWWWLRDVWLDK